MTKLIAILSAILLAMLGLSFSAPATEEPIIEDDQEEIHEMTGTVVEVTDTGILITNTDGQQVQVNTYEETIWEGSAPAAGDLIHVLYNGMMTRSLPPQINALRIGCYVFTGHIVELTETGFTLDTGDDIIDVHAAAELLSGLENGQRISVYFNGAMTMSLPAQIVAELIVPHMAE